MLWIYILDFSVHLTLLLAFSFFFQLGLNRTLLYYRNHMVVCSLTRISGASVSTFVGLFSDGFLNNPC